MPGIVPMALLTILFTYGPCIATLNAFSGQKSRYAWLLCVGLPLSFAVNQLVKIPLLTWVSRFNVRQLAQLLNLPAGYLPSEIPVLGYPVEQQTSVPKKTLDELVLYNVHQ